MKKLILSLTLAVSVVFGSHGATTSIALAANTMTNLLSVQGIAKITQIFASPATAGSAVIQFVDSPTNALTFTNAAYTNTFSYITNDTIANYTNYFGVTTLLTNTHLVDVTNHVVNASTNAYPVRIILSTATNGTTVLGGVNYYFDQGVWITNASTIAATVGITYQQ